MKIYLKDATTLTVGYASRLQLLEYCEVYDYEGNLLGTYDNIEITFILLDNSDKSGKWEIYVVHYPIYS